MLLVEKLQNMMTRKKSLAMKNSYAEKERPSDRWGYLPLYYRRKVVKDIVDNLLEKLPFKLSKNCVGWSVQIAGVSCLIASVYLAKMDYMSMCLEVISFFPQLLLTLLTSILL